MYLLAHAGITVGAAYIIEKAVNCPRTGNRPAAGSVAQQTQYVQVFLARTIALSQEFSAWSYLYDPTALTEPFNKWDCYTVTARRG